MIMPSWQHCFAPTRAARLFFHSGNFDSRLDCHRLASYNCRCQNSSVQDMNRVSSKIAYKKVTHVIFDLDGLLLDTERLYTKATQNVLSKYNKTIQGDLRRNLLGLPGRDGAKMVVKALNLPIKWDEYYKLVKEQYPLMLCDATLKPDTESIYKQMMCDLAKSYGKVYTPEIRSKVMGRTETEGVEIAVRELQLPVTVEQFLQKYRATAVEYLKDIKLMPGAERLVRHLHSKQVPIAVATSSGEDSYNMKVSKHLALFSLFNHIVAGGTDPAVKQGKPAPDIFLACASRFNDCPKPEQCLVFEDAPSGVQAAVSAGMQVVMVPDKDTDPGMCKNATFCLNSLEEVKPEVFELPAFQ